MATTEDNNKQEKIDLPAELEKARKEEREKLYQEMDKLKQSLTEKTKVYNDTLVTVSDLQQQLSTKDSELVKKNGEIANFETKLKEAEEKGKLASNTELETLKKEIESYKQLVTTAKEEFEAFKKTAEVTAYAKEKLVDIDEEFRALVKGNTKEEVDASYEQAKALQEAVKAKYSKKDSLPPTPQTARTPLKSSDVLKRLKEMSDAEYAEARKNNFKK